MSAFGRLILTLACCALAGVTLARQGMKIYDEPWRPQYHFSPSQNFMNDPNGLYYDGVEYHLFYQYNPFGDRWGHMSWGHAASRDLVRWEHLPVALREENGIMIFSGSAVVDRADSSGLCGAPCPIAIYTGHTNERQTQNIAFSRDRGRTWTKFAGNPVIDLGERDFRDPKVIWYEPTRIWVMATVLAQQHKVRFFSSTDLKKWEALSDFGPAAATGGVWECPDLFPLEIDGDPRRVKWVLQVGLNPGGLQGGSGGQYFIGDFDGVKFTADDAGRVVRWDDYGKDFYAAVSWSDAPGRVWIGWMNNWQYANDLPTRPWRGQQSLPRVLKLKSFNGELKLIQLPVPALSRLRGRKSGLRNLEIAGERMAGRGIEGDALEIAAEFELDSAREFGLKVRQGAGEETIIGYDTGTRALFIDRTRAGESSFSKDFTGRHEGPLAPVGERVRLRIFIDRSSVEVFGGDGETVITDLIYPRRESRGVALYAKDGRVKLVSLDAWPLNSIWGKGSHGDR